ncbi:hypothetical protein M5K25_004088 [Dendrobium thyrsiflorum]|uniref:PB1 domain-containing protein n=1 Tax=Dendrobium thyrsiflorum TaxID=117978 RepID=A0ABD0VSI4_DENTH
MSGRGASFILMYGGQLSFDDKYSPTYVGGSYRPLQVGVKTNLDQLKMRVLKALKYDMSKYTVNLVCRLPLGNEFIGSPVEDDEVCEMVLSHAIRHILLLYVELKEISAQNVVAEQTTSEVHASFTFDGVTEGSMTNPSIVPQCADERRRSFCQDVAGTSERPSGNLDDGYETMSSGSTDPCPDDGDDESNYNLDEANVDMNNEIHSIVHRYCYTNIGTAEGINVNNEFVKTYSTTREWDEDVSNDSEYVYIDDPHYFDWINAQQPLFTSPVLTTDPYDAGPSSYPDLGPSQSHLRAELDIASTPQFVPSSLYEHPVSHPDVSDQEKRHLRTRPLQAPQHFTQGTDAIPHRRKRRH